MATKRSALSHAQWERIVSHLPGKAGDPGRTGNDSRLFANDRNRIERGFNRPRHFRPTRYDRRTIPFNGRDLLAATSSWLR